MTQNARAPVCDLPRLREQTGVFRNRKHAGEVLAELLEDYRGTAALVLAVPAGGVPVAAAAAGQLDLPLDVAVVSKVTPPWNSEWGFGAVAFDDSVVMNESILPSLDLHGAELQACVDEARAKVKRRVKLLRGDRARLDLAGRDVIVVDDGLATGITMRAAVSAIQRAGAGSIAVAVPTAHEQSVRSLTAECPVRSVYCANVRGGPRYAVAEAYEHWHDATDAEVAAALAKARGIE